MRRAWVSATGAPGYTARVRPRDLLALEFPRVCARLAEFAASSAGQERCRALTPTDRSRRRRRGARAHLAVLPPARAARRAAAARLRRRAAAPAQRRARGLRARRQDAGRGAPDAGDDPHRRRVLPPPRRTAPTALADLPERLVAFPHLENALQRALDDDGIVLDQASDALARVRATIRRLRDSLTRKLEELVQRRGMVDVVADTYVTLRNNRFVVPVRVAAAAAAAGRRAGPLGVGRDAVRRAAVRRRAQQRAAARRARGGADRAAHPRRPHRAGRRRARGDRAQRRRADRGRLPGGARPLRPRLSLHAAVVLRRHDRAARGAPSRPAVHRTAGDADRPAAARRPQRAGRHRSEHRRQDRRAQDARPVRADGAERPARFPPPRAPGCRASRRCSPTSATSRASSATCRPSPPTSPTCARSPRATPTRRWCCSTSPASAPIPRKARPSPSGCCSSSPRARARLAITTHYTPVKLFALDDPRCAVAAVDFDVDTSHAALPPGLRLDRPQPGAADRAPARPARRHPRRRRRGAVGAGAHPRRRARAARAHARRSSRRELAEAARAAAALAERDAESQRLLGELRERRRTAWAAELREARAFVRALKDEGRAQLQGLRAPPPSAPRSRASPASRRRRSRRAKRRPAAASRAGAPAAPPPARAPPPLRVGDVVAVADRGIRGELLAVDGAARLDPARHHALRGADRAAAHGGPGASRRRCTSRWPTPRGRAGERASSA